MYAILKTQYNHLFIKLMNILEIIYNDTSMSLEEMGYLSFFVLFHFNLGGENNSLWDNNKY